DLRVRVGGNSLMPPLPGEAPRSSARDGRESLGRGRVAEEERPLSVVHGERDGEGIETRP
ncbi:MAG: hypothetical protein WBN62_10870, partial [Thermoanaerobaculia bacterium]